jgi:hypothetical protein
MNLLGTARQKMGHVKATTVEAFVGLIDQMEAGCRILAARHFLKCATRKVGESGLSEHFQMFRAKKLLQRLLRGQFYGVFGNEEAVVHVGRSVFHERMVFCCAE